MTSLDQYGPARRNASTLGSFVAIKGVAVVAFCLANFLLVEVTSTPSAHAQAASSVRRDVPTYPAGAIVLGEGDEVVIRVLGIEELDGKPARIDPNGYLDLPLAGKIHAVGLTVQQLESEVALSLRRTVKEPIVSITVSDYRSRSVSVFGAVNTPGQYPLSGDSTLLQILSKAGGLRNDAGNTIVITRSAASGAIPLDTAAPKDSGAFWVATVSVKSLIDGSDLRQNITLKPLDVVSVRRADLVYVLGAVRRPGGFVLNERGSIGVLQALALAEGLDKTAAPSHALVVRRDGSASTEIKVNIPYIIKRKSEDIALLADDVLVVPASGTKTAIARVIEATIQTGVGIAIYHPPF